MPADYPVIYLAFAQAPQFAPLELKQERKGIRSVLEALHDKHFIELDGEPNTDVEDIYKAFARFAGRLSIFHFAGHAGQSLLELEDTPAHAQGLSKLFGEAKDSLRLVFLNGCSTFGQVKGLHEAGIPAVIATSRPVGDELAKRFAIEFYSQLANHRTLEQAFNRAAALLQTLRQGFDCRIHRGVSQFSKSEQAASHQNFPISSFSISNLPWGLYVSEGDGTVLQWALPKIAVPPPPVPNRDASFDEGLVRVVEEMAKHNHEIAALSAAERRRKAKALVLENFPWLISAQLQVLIAGRNGVKAHGMARLRQLVETYVAATRLMSYTLLSQVWDELDRRRWVFRQTIHFSIKPNFCCRRFATGAYSHLHPSLRSVANKTRIVGVGMQLLSESEQAPVANRRQQRWWLAGAVSSAGRRSSPFAAAGLQPALAGIFISTHCKLRIRSHNGSVKAKHNSFSRNALFQKLVGKEEVGMVLVEAGFSFPFNPIHQHSAKFCGIATRSSRNQSRFSAIQVQA